MSAVTTEIRPFLPELEAARAARASGEPAAVASLRERAAARFAELGLPTTRHEEWRFTNLAPVARLPYRRAHGQLPADIEARLAPHRLPGAVELVFVSGRLAPGLSRLGELPAGLEVGSLATLLAASPDGKLAELGRPTDFADHALAALNTALFADGAFVRVAPGAVVDRPVHLLFLGHAEEGVPTAAFPRVLLLAGERSQMTVVERYAGADGESYLTCPVTELVASPGAVVDHYKVQREGSDAHHLAVFTVETGRGANVTSHSISLGGALVRHDVRARLAGEGGEATLNGLYMVRGRQFVDTHMRVDHAEPHCASHELYKGILNESARAVFNGRIYVHPHAQKTDAKQTNRNLLLSKEALVNTNPQLEIFADDVRCTHGSTVGQLDADAIFYLRSRGIGEVAAQSLLTYAFASDIVERIRVEPVRQELREFLLDWIPHGEVVRDAT
ncbi:MAG TPA: Fe-S cluster assembly protein SufD [Thermoanaerobaculia bacterium]|nr:Fe-S cluster assembly protein SufD [Thermoanaerobaculia bacterium]